jgi:ABC-type Fe3+/spermidine/putrescine transport system ATPase subunit
MNDGRVEQIGSPREIYERPETAFVADFIGSLNVLELTVDEVVGAYAVMRLGEGERVIVAAGADARTGAAIRVATRPEQVQIEPVESGSPEGESRLEGTIDEIVFLGMYTQFHIDTRAGRVVSHRLADESLSALDIGSRVALHWAPEHASLLDDTPPLAIA